MFTFSHRDAIWFTAVLGLLAVMLSNISSEVERYTNTKVAPPQLNKRRLMCCNEANDIVFEDLDALLKWIQENFAALHSRIESTEQMGVVAAAERKLTSDATVRLSNAFNSKVKILEDGIQLKQNKTDMTAYVKYSTPFNLWRKIGRIHEIGGL
jgi:Skp family chaperone for outer membrane proteins